MKEIWKQFETNYAISNLGHIKNVNTSRILKLRKSHNGYLKTNISVNGKIKTIFIHRLVAETFIPNPGNLLQVNHKDENKTNNCVNNLEWCDAKYNRNYGTATERIMQKRRKTVYQYDMSGNLIKQFKSNREASRILNINSGMISQVCNGKRKSYKGFIYKY